MGGVVAVLALMIGVQTAAAGGSTAVQTDPRASSPAGVIYQIPLNSARRSAAPVLLAGSHGGGPKGGAGSSGNPSSIHSENGFGSSSNVPGVNQAALRTGAGVAAARTPGSSFPTFLLIALIAAAAIAAGVLAAAVRRHVSGGTEYPGRP